MDHQSKIALDKEYPYLKEYKDRIQLELTKYAATKFRNMELSARDVITECMGIINKVPYAKDTV